MKEQIATWRWAVGAALLSSALGLGLWGLTSTEVQADRGEQEEDEHKGNYRHRGANGLPVDPTYAQECGSCHLAYPAFLLPQQSWQAIMMGLEDHFGENAQLDAETNRAISDYLKHHAADNGSYQNKRYLSHTSNKPQLRITEQRFFVREHDELPARLVTGNDKVGSFSRCEACHQDAAKGNFDEHRISIPGYGRWDD